MDQYRHILAATDFSPLGDAAVGRAAALAISCSAKLTLVHVLENSHGGASYTAYSVHERAARLDQARALAQGALAEASSSATGDSGVAVNIVIAEGEPADAVLAAIRAEAPDLVVLATRGRRGLERLLLGSVTERIVRESPKLKVDVLVVS